MREMLEGGARWTYLTGDYLAELTMLILGKDTMKDPSLGLRADLRPPGSRTASGLALESGVKIVSNAGGLNPAGLADRLREVATGPRPRRRTIAHVEGDDLRARSELGLRRRADRQRLPRRLRHRRRARRGGADVVVTGRVTDASLVVGPAVAHFGWTPDVVRRAGRRRRRRARARVRHPGHRRQLLRLPRRCRTTAGRSASRSPRSPPTARSVITKHAGTGGAVTVDTVTAQLVYEIQSTHYLGPDVTTAARLASQLAQPGPDRVAITGVRGEAPPEQLKVCVNELGGFRNTVEFVLTGLDIEAKADWVREQLDARGCTASRGHLDAGPRARRRTPTPRRARPACCGARSRTRSPTRSASAFTGPAVELALGVVPRLHDDRAARPAARRTASTGPAYVDRAAVTHTVVHADGRREVIADPTEFAEVDRPTAGAGRRRTPRPPDSLTRRMPLGTFVHARSGDKGGDANLGLWVVNDGSRQVRRPRHLADQADHPAQGPRAGAGGRRPRGRGLRAAQPRRASTC